MSKPKGSRFTLPGLALIVAVGSFGLPLLGLSSAQAGQALEEAKSGHKLQSLSELDDKAPARRSLNVQTWNTAEGARVLFVEAHELPMFDLRLTFAAGSSQDGKTPGLATLTNAMLNEGVAGKDVGAIAQGFEGLGADFGNGSYKDMAIASLRSLSAADKREPALKLFAQVVGKPTLRPGTAEDRPGQGPASQQGTYRIPFQADHHPDGPDGYRPRRSRLRRTLLG